MLLPLTLVVLARQRSVGITVPSSARWGHSRLVSPLECVVQVRGLVGRDRGGFVDVAVAGGSTDAVVAGRGGGVGSVAEVAQDHDRLVVAGQGTGPLAGAAQCAFGGQEAGQEENSSPGGVEVRHLAFYLGHHVYVHRTTIPPPGSDLPFSSHSKVTGVTSVGADCLRTQYVRF